MNSCGEDRLTGFHHNRRACGLQLTGLSPIARNAFVAAGVARKRRNFRASSGSPHAD
jgi:hypothetical protein